MSCHEIEPLLDDYVDDEIGAGKRRDVDRHLSECADCSRIADDLRSIVDAASKLPRRVSPGRDLFPDIAKRIDSGDVGVPVTHLSRRRIPWMGIAAAWLIVSVAGAMALMWRGGAGHEPTAAGAPPEAMLASGGPTDPLEAAVREYRQAADELWASIQTRRDSFSPETLEVLEKNLAIIDTAIAEVQATLEADPKGRGGALALTAMHEQKVELLRRVSRLSSLIAI